MVWLFNLDRVLTMSDYFPVSIQWFLTQKSNFGYIKTLKEKAYLDVAGRLLKRLKVKGER
jgi:hypothetical protein